MSDRYRNNLTLDFGDYSPDSILDDYRKAASGEQPAPSAERIAQHSRQKVTDALRDLLSQYRQAPAATEEEAVPQDGGADEAPAPENGKEVEAFTPANAKEDEGPAPETSKEDETPAPEPPAVEDTDSGEQPPLPEDGGNGKPEASPARPKRKAQISPDGIITLNLDLPPEAAPVRRPTPAAHTTRPATLEDYVRMEAEATGAFPAYKDTPENIREAPPKLPNRPPQKAPAKRPALSGAARRPAPKRETPPKRSLLQFLKDTDEPAPQETDTPLEPDAPREQAAPQEPAGPSRLERLLRPAVRQIATLIAKRELRKAEAAKWPDPEDVPEGPELAPKKAGKFYASQLRPLRFRCRTCLFLCLLLAWVSMQAPMAGVLGQSVAVQAGACLVVTISVMVAALDVVAAGVRQLFDLRPGAECLAVLGTVFSCIDALLVMLGYGDSLPFCAVGGFALSAALWGQRRFCLAQVRTLRVASFSKAASVTVGEGEDQSYLIRSQRGPEGTVRRSEQPDLCQNVYAAAAPILLAACLVLAVLASLPDGSRFLHTLSALLSVSASFTAFLSFPLPYSITAKRLQSSGAAIAGYAGCASIGKTKRLVIMDGDLFPAGTIKLNLINIQEGTFVPKVISSTYSLLEASGSGLTGIFQELVLRRGYSRLPIEEFQCHEGGGLSGLIQGERVLVGSAGFMNLMGIRLPQNMTVRNTVCTAINQELVAVFALEYTPTSSVQDALVTLLQGRTQPVFAIRDFNITPLMIRQLFRMPTDNFNFPSFRARYRIAETSEQEDSAVAAIVSRGGMGPMVDAMEAGRRLYNTCRTGAILSLLGSITGMLILFLLFRAGSYDTATAGNVLSYMLLWAMPVVILSFGQGR